MKENTTDNNKVSEHKVNKNFSTIVPHKDDNEKAPERKHPDKK